MRNLSSFCLEPLKAKKPISTAGTQFAKMRVISGDWCSRFRRTGIRNARPGDIVTRLVKTLNMWCLND